MLDNDQELAHFLVDAKQRTYAAADNNTSVQPILPSSVQLEYRNGDCVYRDIYFGQGRSQGLRAALKWRYDSITIFDCTDTE